MRVLYNPTLSEAGVLKCAARKPRSADPLDFQVRAEGVTGSVLACHTCGGPCLVRTPAGSSIPLRQSGSGCRWLSALHSDAAPFLLDICCLFMTGPISSTLRHEACSLADTRCLACLPLPLNSMGSPCQPHSMSSSKLLSLPQPVHRSAIAPQTATFLHVPSRTCAQPASRP